ncbi:hypothetical protein ACH6EH_06780 [Paenibacillus sp. JSM ZJ436]|uniref:hypothetical protein n=1 Tax=Paenibacillus sp. JSM ZJ436 TaxID=3376190 RepID=UPI00379DBE66
MNIVEFTINQTKAYIQNLNQNYIFVQDIADLIDSAIQNYQLKFNVNYIPTLDLIRKLELAIEDQFVAASISIKY